MYIKKKIVAVVTALTVFASVASPALALTAEELQAQITALLAQLSALQDQLAQLQGGGTGTVTGCTITSFTQNLKQGMSGEDVKCLQIVLNTDPDTKLADTGAGSPGNETTYFGPITKAAVIKFQEKYATEVLAPWGLTTGTGFVGSTTRTKLDTFLAGGGVTPGPVPTAATVSLAVDTPAAGQVALNSQDVMFAKIKFTAGATAYTVTQIIISRGGVSADADVSSIKLYDGSTQLGSTQALNTTTHKAVFGGLSWEIPSYTTKYLTVKGSIAAQGTATVGDSIQLGIASASDISSTATPSGTFPIMSNARTIAGISVGELFVAKQNTPATTTILSGATDQEIACWRFTATTTEGFNVNSLKISHVGTAARDDISNLVLKVAGAQIGSTIASLDASNQATFDLSSSPYGIIGGASKDLCVYADIASGIWTSRTVIFEITQYTDVVAYGANSGGAVNVSYNDTTAFSKQTGNTMTVGQGTLAIALDAALNPSGQNYVKGTTNREITAVKFSTGATEGVRITKLRFTLTGASAAATDISNVTLWDGTTQIAGPASVIGSYVTFGANTIGWDTTGLFDLEPSSNKTIMVKGDIPVGATTNHGVILSIASASDVWGDGLNSQYDLPSGSVSGSATGNEHTVSPYGSLAVSKASDTPSAQTYVKGETGKTFTKINLTAGAGEDIIVTSITVRCYKASGQTTACTSGNVSNVKLVKEDSTQFGSTVANPTATASFSGSLTVPAAETVTLLVVADIPSTSAASYLHLDVKLSSVATDVTSTGVSSGADIEESGSAHGNVITVGTGSLTISAAATPGDQYAIVGTTELPMLGMVMTAGTGEDIRVTRFVLKRSYKSGAGCESADVSSIALWEGDTRLTVKKGWDSSNSTNTTFSASDFLNGLGIDIAKGQQKTITVRADLPSTGTANDAFAIGIASSTESSSDATATTSDVTFVGLESNTSPAPRVTIVSGLGGVNYTQNGNSGGYFVTLAERGLLTVITTADTPITAIKSVSIEGVQVPGVAFHKSLFKASLEQVDVKTISVRRSGGRDDDFTSVSLYEGDTLLAGPQTLANGSTTFSFTPGNYWRLPTVGARYLTIKATLNGIKTAYGYGSQTGDAPQLGLGNVTAEGVDSGLSPTGAGWLNKMGNAQIIRQSQPTVALASPTSEQYGAGTKELIRWTVSADSLGNVGWQKITFDISGGIVIGTTSYTVGSYVSGCGQTAADGIYISTSTTCGDAVATQLIATSSVQVWDVDTNTQINATSTWPTIWVDQATATGTARLTFVPYIEQQVGAGTTKTYKLIANVLKDGVAGSSLMTKIASRGIYATTSVYNTYHKVAATSSTFIWSDRSGASVGAHSLGSADWTTDYKVIGIPTTAKTLSK
jgi:hypothetical protein